MDILTTKQVAAILKTSHATALRFITKGGLKALKVGFQYRIRRQDLADFLKIDVSELKTPEPAQV